MAAVGGTSAVSGTENGADPAIPDTTGMVASAPGAHNGALSTAM